MLHEFHEPWVGQFELAVDQKYVVGLDVCMPSVRLSMMEELVGRHRGQTHGTSGRHADFASYALPPEP